MEGLKATPAVTRFNESALATNCVGSVPELEEFPVITCWHREEFSLVTALYWQRKPATTGESFC